MFKDKVPCKKRGGPMENTDSKIPYSGTNLLRKKLLIIESLVFLIPILSVVYIIFQKQISFNTTQLIIILAALCLVLGGMLILKQVFDRIFTIQNFIQTAERGGQYVLDTQKGTDELHEITKSFNNLAKNFQESNIELQRSIKEIAERKKIEAALQVAKDQSEAANMAKTRFLANMSHEFLTPLNAVIGFSQLLETKTHGELNEKQIEYIRNVMESGQNLLNLVNGILELSKIETEGVKLKLSTFDIKYELQRAVNLILKTADKKEISLAKELQPDLPPITADQEKFKQIIINLLNNAVKFTPAGGSIILAAKTLMGSELEIPCYEDPDMTTQVLDIENNFLQISISDTGIGVKPEDRERIFSIFEQVDISSQRLFNGTGLGLAMSRKIVELHNGKIWMESEGEGKGSSFTFVLPFIAI
jgi:signal transduction histidine kinase